MVIYRITNKLNGKMYIGQTVNIDKRWKTHCRWSNSILSTAIKKYGAEAFSITVLGDYDTEEMLNDAEDYYIDFYNSLSPNGYNAVTGGQKNRIWSKESLAKASASKSGNKNPMFGKKASTKVREAASIANKGKPKSAEHKEKLRLANLGKKATLQARKNMSIAAKKSINSGRFVKGSNTHGDN